MLIASNNSISKLQTACAPPSVSTTSSCHQAYIGENWLDNFQHSTIQLFITLKTWDEQVYSNMVQFHVSDSKLMLEQTICTESFELSPCDDNLPTRRSIHVELNIPTILLLLIIEQHPCPAEVAADIHLFLHQNNTVTQTLSHNTSYGTMVRQHVQTTQHHALNKQGSFVHETLQINVSFTQVDLPQWNRVNAESLAREWDDLLSTSLSEGFSMSNMLE